MSRTVLIVDDADFLRDLVSRVLMEDGYRVLWANNVASAWSLLERDRADLIVLDLDLPKSGALDFLRLLRSQSDWRHLPVLMLAENVRPDVRQRAMKLGASDFLMKNQTLPHRLMEKVNLHFAAQSSGAAAVQSLLF